MKKIIFPILVLTCVFMLTGCSLPVNLGNNIVCTGEESSGNYTVKSKVIATLSNGKVSTVKADMTFSDEATAKTTCNLLSTGTNDYDVKCNGDTITITGFEKMTELSGDKITDVSKDEFISYFEKEGYTCK